MLARGNCSGRLGGEPEPYGAFVDLKDGLSGLVRYFQISQKEFKRSPRRYFRGRQG